MFDLSRFNTHPVITDAEVNAVTEVLRSGKLSEFRGAPGEGFYGGKKIKEFERNFAHYFDDIKHALTFNSCTSALHAACVACGIGEGDEVIVSPFTFSASAKCVMMAGGKPVFADIKPDIFCLDPESIEKLITPKTRAIIPVHLCGHPADMANIMSLAFQYNLYVIEDAAQSIGATYSNLKTGTIGHCGVFSFDRAKTISTGEGGMLITNDDEIAYRAALVRNHGEMLGENIIGYNYRMTEMQAALGIVQFAKLDELNAHRIELCNYMTERLSKIDCLIPPVVYDWCTHVYFTYPIRCADTNTREKLIQGLDKKDIYMWRGYIKPLHLLPLYGGKMGDCPVAERMWSEELAITDRFRLPVTLEDMEYIANYIEEILC